MEKQTAATVVADPLKVAEVRKQVINYKVFCVMRGISSNNANSLSLFFKQAKAGVYDK